MPNRTILNKYGLFVSQVHKVLKKRELDREDAVVINKARLVATLSSNHSWRAYRFLHCGDSFERELIREEIRAAFNEGWKEITENDVKEIATAHVEEHALCQLFTCFEGPDSRRNCKELLIRFQKELTDGIEPIETMQQMY
jgi:hypothetical protein